ncbi:hypothetical protein [Niallia endozanthoxylica]|uniref:Uncharacterized protein n=1 Tax=Niallia endozanthoxylica TaxID=2036016 RepID=A0A5J5GV26_9BACI|nr:hypothetical protein [Niallia endozanthoxylica]KAA9012110.1 hypothetical protein F4V44_26045 [Niallia endozanthoxylica]
MIFEIWRGPVGVGNPIYRATDSAQASNVGSNLRLTFDNLAVTSVVHVDETAGNNTYHLTARLGTAGDSAAMVIGPITFYGEEIDVS